MEQKDFEIIKLDASFQTSFENMDYDKKLLDDLKSSSRIERFYIWQNPELPIVTNKNVQKT